MDINNFINTEIFNQKSTVFALFTLIFGMVLGSYYGIGLFDYKTIKILLFAIVIYCYIESPILSLIIALLILGIYQFIFVKNLEKFNPVSNINSDYSNTPLLKESELTPISELDLNLVTPDKNDIKLIETGQQLLNDYESLENDLSKKYDSREQDIANMTKRNAMVDIKSGINQLTSINDVVQYGTLLPNKNIEMNNIFPERLNMINKKLQELKKNMDDKNFEVEYKKLLELQYNLVSDIMATNSKLQSMYQSDFLVITDLKNKNLPYDENLNFLITKLL